MFGPVKVEHCLLEGENGSNRSELCYPSECKNCGWNKANDAERKYAVFHGHLKPNKDNKLQLTLVRRDYELHVK